MKTSSAKAKGRRLAQSVKELLLSWAPDLTERDVQVTPSGVTGVDVALSEAAFKVYPLAIECKNQEKLNVWESIKQAESHVKVDEIPVLCFTRNREKIYIALELEKFLKLTR